MDPVLIALLLAALAAGLVGAALLRRRRKAMPPALTPEQVGREARRILALRGFARLRAALDDDPARAAAADAFGVAPDEVYFDHLAREWTPIADARPFDEAHPSWVYDPVTRHASRVMPPHRIGDQVECRVCGCQNHESRPACALCGSRLQPEPRPRDLRVYVASSWRNPYQQAIVRNLSMAGHEVYDFRNPPNRAGFAWGAIAPDWKSWDTAAFVEHLQHQDAIAGFDADMNGLSNAHACVLVLPCGRSAHLEAGWAAGRGIPLLILAPEPCEPELMYRMARLVTDDEQEIEGELETIQDELSSPAALCGSRLAAELPVQPPHRQARQEEPSR